MRRVPALFISLGLAVASLSLSAADFTQIRVPRLPRNVPREIPRLDRLPSLDDLLNRQPLTSSLDDALSELPFLDSFDPAGPSPLLELPPGFDDGVTMVPGFWSATVQSYCLKAGTFGPTRGDGYLWAPLKGAKADLITAILNRSSQHPELSQNDIQVLLWGIIARSKVSEMQPGPRRAAELLLSESQLASIDTSALDLIPDDWLRKITAPIEGPVRRVLEAENQLRRALANPTGVAYEELERIAVLNGVPPLSERTREVPRGRWSWHPNGFFIRFLPSSYTNLQLQIYSPERFTAQRGADGVLSELRDQAGAVLRIQWEGGGPVRAVFAAAPGVERVLQIGGGDSALARARAAAETMTRLAGARADSPRAQDVVDVARIAAGIDDEQAAAFLQRALASAAGDLAKTAGAVAALERARYQSASLGGLLAAPMPTVAPVPQRGGGWGGGGGGSGGGGGGGGMGGGGRQRLGPSLRKFGDDNSIDRARKAVNNISNANDALGAVTDPASLVSGGITGALFGRILDFNFDSYEQAAGALAGDPPRDDFREFSKPVIPAIPTVDADAKMAPERAERLNALMRDLITANAYMQAGIVALDRHGGAVKNGDRLWATRQAHALTYLKREAGVLSLRIVEQLEALTKDAEVNAGRTMLIEGIRELGEHFASLPVLGPPW